MRHLQRAVLTRVEELWNTDPRKHTGYLNLANCSNPWERKEPQTQRQPTPGIEVLVKDSATWSKEMQALLLNAMKGRWPWELPKADELRDLARCLKCQNSEELVRAMALDCLELVYTDLALSFCIGPGLLNRVEATCRWPKKRLGVSASCKCEVIATYLQFKIVLVTKDKLSEEDLVLTRNLCQAMCDIYAERYQSSK